MIVAALIEFAVVLILKHALVRKEIEPQNKPGEENSNNKNADANLVYGIQNQRTSKNGDDIRNRKINTTTYERIDQASFYIFPIIYALFNLTYALTYQFV